MNFLTKKTIEKFLRKTGVLIVVIVGLLTIVGTGKEDDDDSNSAPSVRIDAPADSAVFQLDNEVTFTGTATDAEESSLKGSALSWSSSVDGHIGSGASFTTNNLSQGTHLITLTATDDQGLADSASISIIINPSTNTLPVATITYPATGLTFDDGDFIQFTGTGFDTEDQWLSGLSLVWYSNKDGQLGTGASLTTNDLSGGTHTISLQATDSENTSNIDTITVIIRNTPPVATINSPADGATFLVGQSISFDGMGVDTEDGNLTGYSLKWTTSNGDYYGPNIIVANLPAGEHIVNLWVTDEGGLMDSDSITITIE
ncbi:MAG: hypothetical protein WC799_01940 [Desulfobacteraceae bacterium]|jgi:hypothetical protein